MNLTLKLNSSDMINSQKKLFIPLNIEYLILGLVATIGLVGSIYIFAANTGGNSNNNFNQFATATAIAADTDSDESSSFSDYMKISGKKRVGNEIHFTSKMDIKEKRYVMEMGDGMRMIITQPEFSYQYKEKGKYLLELKTIERGLITTVATYNLKVR